MKKWNDETSERFKLENCFSKFVKWFLGIALLIGIMVIISAIVIGVLLLIF